MYLTKRIVFFILLLFISGCDIASVGFVAIKTKEISDANKVVSQIDVNKILEISDYVAKNNSFVKQTNIPEAFAYLSPIVMYKIQPDITDGSLGYLIYFAEDRKILVIDIRGIGGYRNRDWGIKLQKDLYDHLVSEFGTLNVFRGYDWKSISKQMKTN